MEVIVYSSPFDAPEQSGETKTVGETSLWQWVEKQAENTSEECCGGEK